MSSHQTDVDIFTVKRHIDAMHHQTCTVSHSTFHGSDAHTVPHGICTARQDRSRSNTHAPSTVANSWFSEKEYLSSRASGYYSDLFALYTTQESTDATSTGDCHVVSGKSEAWKASVITNFTGVMASDFKVKDADVSQHEFGQNEGKSAQSQSFFKKRYQRVKEIYQNGPPGEGQMFWAGVKSYLKGKETGVVFEMSPRKPMGEAIREPSPESVALQQVADQPLHQPHVMTHGMTEGVDEPKPRRDSAVSYSDISRTSCEVPIKLRRTVLIMDPNELLSSSPPLSAAPKERLQKAKGKVLDIDKPLPRTPFPCFSDMLEPSEGSADQSPVDPLWPPTHVQMVGLETPICLPEAPRQGTQERLEPDTQGPQQPTWLKTLAKKPPSTHLRSTSKSNPSKAQKAHDSLKAKISRPIPIPPAVNLSPAHLAPYADTVGEKAKGKQKIPSSPAWLNKLAHPTMPTMHKAKKRPDSDESFACQGLGEGSVGDGGRSVQEGGPRMRVGEGCEGMLRSEPLFARDRSIGSYYDVNDEWADQGRSGWWI